MAGPDERKPSRDTLREMARLVGLDLTDEQLEKIAPDIDALTRNVAALEAIDFGETEPAFIYRPDPWAG
ncbi:MAG: hypothetical protein V3V35_03380 [Dehalococcoidia bacterium]